MGADQGQYPAPLFTMSSTNWVHSSVLAEHLKVTNKTIQRMILRNDFPVGAVIKVGTQVRVDLDACVAHLVKK